MTSLKELFLLRNDVVYLNHGSFGACPKPVFDEYQRIQLELEREPVEFLHRGIDAKMKDARSALATYLGADALDIVPLINATMGINTVARSLNLKPGDEILASNHEYGACVRSWKFICEQTGAVYKEAPIPLPISSKEEIIEKLWKGVNPKTKVIFLSHITSPTALTFPLKEICKHAREKGIITVIDGAHAPGQIELNLTEIDPDFYTGNCHKWLCSPKGAAFLYARRDKQSLLKPLIISWGYQAEDPGESQFIDHFEWFGTRDPSAFLTVPKAIQFQKEHNWEKVRANCFNLAQEARLKLCALPNVKALYPDSREFYQQMIAVELPPCDAAKLRLALWEKHKIEVVTSSWSGKTLLRLSYQGYNSSVDTERLIAALMSLSN